MRYSTDINAAGLDGVVDKVGGRLDEMRGLRCSMDINAAGLDEGIDKVGEKLDEIERVERVEERSKGGGSTVLYR